ncbi:MULTISPECIES: DegQ family serine endoprotease [Cupriavidus]|jgi:serine protease Do|uniref:Probable periplasmic serine endoprotease DegP-like n=1 Tax=Cupriavidus metallidurans (strain ATCC 43123 / DSM 2839 / NBRC 102507 / CH34) TaxID=266264 RepID=Q1LKM7_CUPMC|nr:DegQ family serine endoprotease [Cupriavidus metallidurans]ABF09299.1 Trypsin-like serine protease, typically periplasmic, contains C-terminal PDZ domain [Cupriavidus metallidurans CH34]AVA36493.1 DegQ family serine endoprotease [Cupriavidus metallidurans]KWW37520.1 putative periplasmic serine endoprotease DegP-like protein [Cupriavidus metallidurans]QGS29828.1 Do family serine endopeptidase [Cupriavidus metallidurans]
MISRSPALARVVVMVAMLVFGPAVSELGHAQAAAQNYNLPDFTDLVEKVSPAVVNIRTTERVRSRGGNSPDDDEMAEFFRRFFGVPMPGTPGQPRRGQPPQGQGQSQGQGEEMSRGVGSGFIISQDGYVMTNAHVVAEADTIYVTLPDKREFKAKLIGADKRTDVALLKIDATGLPRLPLGDSDKVRTGEWVLAIGSPFGLDSSVTAGIVSAKARDTGDYLPLIQTDVAVNPGNSGGPLINLRGEVIGINSQIYSRSGGYMGISFATPIDEAMRVTEQLKATGKVTRGRIAVAIGDVTKEVADSLGLGRTRGALVGSVEPGGPAEKAGIEAGDIILKYNGRDIEKAADLPRMVGDTKPGTRVPMQVWRKGQTREVMITVAELEPDTPRATPRRGDKRGGGNEEAPAPKPNALGLIVNDIPEARMRELKLKSGVEVDTVDGPAARAGIRPGDIILRLGDTDVTSARQFNDLVKGLDKNKMAAVFVRRGDATQVLTLRPNQTR